ncbi:ABC transporter ATP-binding protein [Streptomyces neyagawaensis]|uniref:ABC transporter ATP-binding protein n=1 Tax=Streptomyces neyagawaensis TaxID=42238 RepID=UPI0012FEF098|nr:ABC transporter ATP-binding protein [Streptomyces neyagawaensis]MCL6739300.1 ABC transporter ATP-binding protein [Streptomyces neyagawaensis]MDE1688891.1 ABC transporter ATP-binding protein [Streptomyces neyagawaensis]
MADRIVSGGDLLMAGPSDPVIETKALTKVYKSKTGSHVAVDGVNLRVDKGEFFGLLGSNGAGKSTLIGLLTTVIKPTRGRMRVAGASVKHRPVAVKRAISVVPQRNSLDPQLTLAENLEFHGRMFGLGARQARRRATRLLQECGIEDVASRTIRRVSGGQGRRALIARALMHQPQVLFLDEPTAGVDIKARRLVWNLLRGVHAAGTTIVLTTHYLEEAQELCGRIGILNRGKITAIGSPDKLRSEAGLQTVVTIQLSGDAEAVAAAADQMPEVTKVEHHGDTLRLYTHKPDGLIREVVFLAESAGLHVTSATTAAPSLDRVFLTLTSKTQPGPSVPV